MSCPSGGVGKYDKTSKYEDLKKELEKEGYSVIVKAVEIGAKGSVASNLYQFLDQIGTKDHNRAKFIKRLLQITKNSSMLICDKRNIPWKNSKWSPLNRHLIVNT